MGRAFLFGIEADMKKNVVVVVAGLLLFSGSLAMAMRMSDSGLRRQFYYCSGSGSGGTYRIVTCGGGSSADGGDRCSERDTGIRCSNR
jgi:hypothetical protein